MTDTKPIDQIVRRPGPKPVFANVLTDLIEAAKDGNAVRLTTPESYSSRFNFIAALANNVRRAGYKFHSSTVGPDLNGSASDLFAWIES
jgi:hypothetical protein